MAKFKRYAPKAAFAVYLAVLLSITVIRPGSGGYRFMGGSLHLTVMADYAPILRNSLAWFIYLFVGNIVWFVPFGFYLTFFKGLAPGRTVLFGFLLSLFIETMQFVLGTGISEPDDLILNTFGALLGAGLGLLLRRLCRKNRAG